MSDQTETTLTAAVPKIANELERLAPDAAIRIFNDLTLPEAAAVLVELDLVKAAELLDALTAGEIVARLSLLPPNQIADIFPFLRVSIRQEILRGLSVDLSERVAALLRYAPDTAGGIMDNRFIAVNADDTVSDALDQLRGSSKQQSGDISYVYVVDKHKRLIGVVAFRDLVFSRTNTTIGDIMNHDVSFLQVSDDQEQIALEIQRHPFLGLPVVDEIGHLVGVVRAQDALRVAEAEATEDMQLMVGLSGEERIWTPWKAAIKKRFPWLAINLGTALGGTMVVSLFEGTISRWSALVAFLPLISAVAGNGGNQSLTVIIRSFALGDVTAGDALRTLRKELCLGAANGLVLALAIGLIAFVWKQSALLGVVAGFAMVLNQIIGALAGVAVPFGLKQLKVDPALASSIFVTAITDTLGFLVFLGAATAAMRLFV